MASNEYKVLFHKDAKIDSEVQWELGCPLLLEALQISRNTTTGDTYLQTKVVNISPEIVSSFSAQASITYEDGTTESLTFEPLDADIKPKETYKLETKKLSNGKVKDYLFVVTSTTTSTSKWTSKSESTILAPQELDLSDKALQERTLLIENVLANPDKCLYKFKDLDTWWMCSCGKPNIADTCWCCGALKSQLPELQDSEQLEEKADKREIQRLEELQILEEKRKAYIAEIEAQREAKATAKIEHDKRIKRLRLTALLTALVLGIACILAYAFIYTPHQNKTIYNNAQVAESDGRYIDAAELYLQIPDYKDSAQKAEQAQCEDIYQKAQVAETSKYYLEASELYSQIPDYKDASQRLDDLPKKTEADFPNAQVLDGSSSHTVGIRSNGTVVATGDNLYGQCNVEDWTNIVSVACGNGFTVGLRSDGTVVATGNNSDGQCNVKLWTDVVSIKCGRNNTFGLKSDGHVVVAGSDADRQLTASTWYDIVSLECEDSKVVGLKSDGTVMAAGLDGWAIGTRSFSHHVEDWTDIVSIVASSDNAAGLKSDGTVVAGGYDKYGQCDVNDWRDIASIASNAHHTFGLKSDGTVVSTAYDKYGYYVNDWSKVKAITCGWDYVVGLRSDGTVVATGDNSKGQCDVDSWKNIVSITCGSYYTIGLRSDGTVVATGDNSKGQCDVDSWSLRTPLNSNK